MRAGRAVVAPAPARAQTWPMAEAASPDIPPATLVREMGFLALIATGVCAMVGAAINVIPFMIQRSVPGIGADVVSAYVIGAVPALLAGLAYAILASAMPRAGGSYVYASRGLSPYLGFVASFSQWFSLSVAIGVVAYLIVPFLRDVAISAGWPAVAAALESTTARVAIPVGVLWCFAGVNLRGVRSYVRAVVPLMFLTLVLGTIVIVAGFSFSHADYVAAVGPAVSDAMHEAVRDVPSHARGLAPLGLASVLLFSSFIGFDAIAQAGGEARDPGRAMPRAITAVVVCVGAFYLLFTAAVYHAVPWQYVAALAKTRDLTAPGLLAPLLPRPWQVLMTAGAAIALIKDLPAMLLAVSRLMFAWAEDGIFPAAVQAVHPRWRTPHIAILCSTVAATLSIVGSHLAGDFFLGVDILVTSMLVNFLVMCLAVLALPRHNPALATAVRVFTSRPAQVAIAAAGALILATFLVVQTWRDLTAPAAAWYFRSTPVWALVTAVASVIYWRERRVLARRVPDLRAHFLALPRQ